MPLTQGSRLHNRQSPNASFYQITFNNSTTGSDQFMFVVIACPVTSVAGVSISVGSRTMTNVQNRSTGSYNINWSVWRLDNPPAGSFIINVVLNATSSSFTSTFIQVFSECNGSGNTSYIGTPTSPRTSNITLSQNSMVIGSVIGGNSTSANIEIPINTTRTLLYNTGISTFFTWGSVSPSLSAGTITCEANSNGTMIMMLTEVLEKTSTPVGRRRLIIC